jgi:hypothetical protein
MQRQTSALGCAAHVWCITGGPGGLGSALACFGFDCAGGDVRRGLACVLLLSGMYGSVELGVSL